jgi:hypothetical protein
LDREGVRLLHMRDFAHSTGEFSSWKADEPRRQRLIANVAKIIKRRTHRDFSISFFLDPFRAVEQSYLLTELVAPLYVIAAGRRFHGHESGLPKDMVERPASTFSRRAISIKGN